MDLNGSIEYLADMIEGHPFIVFSIIIIIVLCGLAVIII